MGLHGPDLTLEREEVETKAATAAAAIDSPPLVPPAPTKPTTTTCTFCGDGFPSRSALFRHLQRPVEYCRAPRIDVGEKVALLLGYDCTTSEAGESEQSVPAAAVAAAAAAAASSVTGGDDAASLVLQAIGVGATRGNSPRPAGFSQGSSIGSRTCPLLAQEPGVSATADTACLRAPTTVPVEGIRAWLDETNAVLDGTGVRLLGRMSVPPTFHSEMNATRRRYEYILPAWLVDETAEGPWAGPPRGQEKCIPLLKHLRGKGLRPFGHCNGDHDGRRRRCPLWHNFSEDALPHSPSSARRLYRFYACEVFQSRGADYICLSVSGDAFVSQQVRGMVGLAVAGARGLISAADIASCFDPARQDDLLPVPLAPVTPCSLAEIGYSSWQMRLGGVCMSPGAEQRAAPPLEGWSDETARSDAVQFRRRVLHGAAGWWEERQRGRSWLQDVLQPGALKLRRELDAANERVKDSRAGADDPASAGALSSLEETPAAYAEVLRLLREADASGRWPDSSLSRSTVISGGAVDTSSTGAKPSGLGRFGGKKRQDEHAAAAVETKRTEKEMAAGRQELEQQQQRQQQGGSFTVGAFPPPCPPPRGNRLFPELARAAFELEAVLLPDRPPSTTIAVNRHARFKPHVDSGAGAGQSRSLIVGLGDYVGGELVVEGEAADIRYRPLEFNGWTQRHWTRPFKGERFSLVWFTPKGCEGVAGDARFCVGTGGKAGGDEGAIDESDGE